MTWDDLRVPLLSKSRFTSGLQCHKRLYLECFHRELADEVTEQQQAVFDSGTDVGIVARNLYPGGVLIDEDHLNHEAAVASTRSALSLDGSPPLYEAAFTHEGVRIRADILAPLGNGQYDLVEVKSASRVKDEHVFDAGIQLYVLRGGGLPVRRTCICHLNTAYVYEGGHYDLGRLFQLTDVTAECSFFQAEIPALLSEMRGVLSRAEPPDIPPGRHCISPYRCQFFGHCHKHEPRYPVSELPGAREDLLFALRSASINDIREIPARFPGLSLRQQRVRDCVAAGTPYVSSEIAPRLRQLRRPLHFMDFETCNPALPRYAGTRPYQVIPFQWSVHTLDAGDTLSHREFLHDGSGDPRPAFATALLEALGDSGAVVVYSGYEGSRLRELAGAVPALATQLHAIASGRLVDLLPLVREHCYHPAFHGSYSIKSVLPALSPDLNYDDLSISDGALAAVAYAEMLRPETTAERRAQLRAGLLSYCERDTLAEVELFRFFTR